MIELTICAFIILAVMNFLITNSYKYPPLLYALVWIFALSLYAIVIRFDIFEIYLISPTSLVIFFMGNLFFSLGGAVSYFINNSVNVKSRNIVFYKSKYYPVVKKIIFTIIIITFPLYILKAFEISAHSGMDNFFMGLRTELNYGSENYGIFKYLNTLLIIYILYLNYGKDNRTLQYKFIVLLSFVLAILSTGRTSILLLLIVFIGIKITNNTLKQKDLIYSIFIFITFFFIFALILGKGASLEVDFLQNIKTASIVFVEYIIGSLVAFDIFISSDYILTYGDQSFRIFYSLLYKIGLINTIPLDLKHEFVSIPFITNVYTIYEYYIKDFGIFSVLIWMYVFGLIHSYFYFNYEKSLISRTMYIILLYPLLMSFFQDQYMSIVSTWIQFFIISIFLFKISFKKGKAYDANG